MKKWRISLIFIFFILLGAAIIGRLVFLQILQLELYKALAKGQQNTFRSLEQPRKEIFLQDKNGNLYPAAINKSSPLVYLVPKEVADKQKTAQTLSRILDLAEDIILEKINSADSFYQVVKNKLTKEEKALLEKENLAGVYLRTELLRSYPQGTLASQTIGFLGGEGRGQYGLEGYYDEILRGRENLAWQPKRALAGMLSALENELVLSLDYNIQSMAEKLLEDGQRTLGFYEAQLIVVEPSSGKVLALANFPNFNPNYYEKELDLAVFQNGATQKIFEPGSVFKPITMAAGLETGKISPETTYQDTGLVKIGGYTVYNYDKRVWGERTMTEVLGKSINTGAVFAEQKIGHKTFLDYIEKFGFFEPTGIDLEGEVFSANMELKKGYEINFTTASFGQGIEVNTMQLVRAFSAIANGGRLVTPYLLEGFKDGDKIIKIPEERVSRQILSQKTASLLTTMLVSVVKQGFGKAAQIPGYHIAGKTGTAQISWAALGKNQRGYSDQTIQTFIGFAPAFEPRFLVLVKLYDPQTKTAEYSALPIFRDVTKYIIDYYQIPPEYE